MKDSLPKESTAKLETKGTTFNRGSIKDGTSFSKGQRNTGNVAGVSYSPNMVGEDTKVMPGL